MDRTTYGMPAAQLRAVQDRRRSNAAGKHGDRRARRVRTRTASRARAIGEYR